MEKEYHILNGDSLRERFPTSIKGEIIVACLCLVDGVVKADSLDELFKVRAKFISENYSGFKSSDYYGKSVVEIEKIRKISTSSAIYLWFEDDLFCQVNLWFIIHVLNELPIRNSVYLIRPNTHNQYGFAGLEDAELKEAFKNRRSIRELEKLAKLWGYYQNDDINGLLQIGSGLKVKYPFILNAIEAHVARIPSPNKVGRPAQSLMEIIKDLETDDFGLVFNEFNKRESIYGFGDIQVKRMYDDIIKTKKRNF